MTNILRDISDDELKEFQEIFDLADRDHGGSITQSEFRALLNILGIQLSADQIDKMMSEEGIVGEMHFYQFVRICTKQVESSYSPSYLSRAFRYFELPELPAGWISHNRLEEVMNEAMNDIDKVTEILASINPENAGKINYQLYINMLFTEMVKSVPLFNARGISRKFISALVAKLQPKMCKVGDIIAKKGDIGREMYFVISGFVELISEEYPPKMFAKLGQGKFFGEIALIFEQRRNATARAGSYCDLYVLNQKDYIEVSKLFPKETNIINNEALKRLNATKSVDLFNTRGISKKFVSALMTKLRTRICKPGEIIVKKGDTGNEMYFVTNGNVEVISGQGEDSNPIVYVTLPEGKFFGEIALVFEQKRTATVRAGPNGCDLYVLKKEDFKEVSLEFTKEISLIKKEAEKRLQAQANK